MSIISVIKELWRGKDIYRIYMNEACRQQDVSGFVLDVGSGKTKASYHRFLRITPGAKISFLDLRFEGVENGNFIDLEKDILGNSTESIDTILLFNVLEHLYNYNHILREIKRVLKPHGRLIGVVPFLVNYHPDPHDYWRYTKETLERIFKSNGFTSVTITSFGLGPVSVAWSHIEIVFPRLLKIVFLPLVTLMDNIIIRLKPGLGKDRYPLGFFFVIQK